MGAQASLGQRQLVLHQRRGSFHQPRILGGRLEVARTRLVGTARVARRVQFVGQQSPGIGRVGFQLSGAAQRLHRLAAAARGAAGHREFQMRRSRTRLLARQRLQHLEGELRLT